jgi:hypothetical protein
LFNLPDRTDGALDHLAIGLGHFFPLAAEMDFIWIIFSKKIFLSQKIFSGPKNHENALLLLTL